MKDSRKGESLWSEWEGYGYHYNFGDLSLVYYTEGHVDLDIEVVRKALASAIQRDGVVSSLAQAFQLINNGRISQGYAGPIDGDIYLTVCEDDGSTLDGDQVDKVIEITYVEVQYL
jgi:hypothetical protein